MIKRLAALAALCPILAFAQGNNPPWSKIDWMYVVGNAVDQLTTTNSGTLMQWGMYELAWFIFLGLMLIVIQWTAQLMNFHHFPHLNIGDIWLFIVKASLVTTVMNYYNNPIPGIGYSFHQIPSLLALDITQTINQAQIAGLLKQVMIASTATQQPSVVNILGVIVYVFVLLDMGLISLGLFVMNATSFIFTGVLILFGPIMIPFYMTKRMQMWFWRWFGALVTFAMYRPVAAGFTFVWGSVYTTFFANSVNGNYSIGAWLALIPTMILLTVAFLFTSIAGVSKLSEMMFGGAGAAGSGFAGAVGNGIRAIVAML